MRIGLFFMAALLLLALDCGILCNRALGSSNKGNHIASPKVYLITAFNDPYKSLKGLSKIKKKVDFRKRKHWRIKGPGGLEEVFLKFYSKSNLKPVFIDHIDAPKLNHILLDESTVGVFLLAHVGIATSSGDHKQTPLVIAPTVLQDNDGNNMKDVLEKVHPNIRWLAVLGCNSQVLLDRLGFKSRENFSDGKEKKQVQLIADGVQGFMTHPKKELKKSLERSLNFLPHNSEYEMRALNPQGRYFRITRHYPIDSRFNAHSLKPVMVKMGGQFLTSFPELEFGKSQSKEVYFENPKNRELAPSQDFKVTMHLHSKARPGSDPDKLGRLNIEPIDPDREQFSGKWSLLMSLTDPLKPFGCEHGSQVYKYTVQNEISS